MAPGKKSRHRNESIRPNLVKDADCTEFLQWALPRLAMRWPGFRRVRGQVCKRLGRRMAELGLKESAEYRALLETDPEEWMRLDGYAGSASPASTGTRGCGGCWSARSSPSGRAGTAARRANRLRIWSAGCASGEEPYTLALLFAFGETLSDCPPEILATDADPHLLQRARRACYPATSLRDLPASAGALRSSRSATSIAFGPSTGHRCASWSRISATSFRRADSI